VKYLITGASGLLGLNMALHLAGEDVTGVVNQNKLKDVPFTQVSVDLSQRDDAVQLVEQVKPDILVHCAAIANLDVCERQPEQAKRTNADLPGWLAEAAKSCGAYLIHISTDAVFDGVRGEYSETDATNPIGAYARFKLMGEEAVAAANPQALIARVNFYGWSLGGKRSLSEFFFNNLRAGNTVNGFTDIYFCPLLVNELVRILLRMAEKRASGIYHVLSPERLSKYEFGRRLARQFNLDENLIQPASWKDAGLTSARSPNLTLKVDKLAKLLGSDLPTQAPMLEEYCRLYHAGYPQRLASFRSE